MNRATLKKYAEAGVRQRLEELQKEINLLATEFPEIVRNRDGSLPAVAPMTLRTPTGNVRRSPAGAVPDRLERDARRHQIWLYLKAHPQSTVGQIADAIGLQSSTSLRHLIAFVGRVVGGGKGGVKFVARQPEPHAADIVRTAPKRRVQKRRKSTRRAKAVKAKPMKAKPVATTNGSNGTNGHKPVIVPGVPSLSEVKSPVAAAAEILKKAETPLSVKELFANLRAHHFKGKTTLLSLGVGMRQEETRFKHYGIVGVRAKGSPRVQWTLQH